MAATPGTAELLARLADPDRRVEAAAALARRLGAEELLLFVCDPVLEVLVPAPGLPQTIRGGRAWRSFLASCHEAGRQAGEVDLPPDAGRPALGLATGQVAAIFVGGAPGGEELDEVESLLPLLAASLRGELELALAHAEVASAREAANRAQALAAALEGARAEASRLNVQLHDEHRRKDDFLAMLAHELRNPLAPLVSSIELLRRRGGDARVLGDQLDVMTRQVGQLSRLVEDLLDVARVSHGQVDMRLEELRLRDALADAVEASRPVIDGRRHRVGVTLPEEPLWVRADRVRLTQVFANLLHNAAKYTDHGGRIDIEVKEEAGQAAVRVRDSGVGIDAETLPHIFGLFAQAPRARDRAQGGLGIGLTLVRSIVELHGGDVRAESAGIGQGSTFTVRLPLIAAVSRSAPAASAPATRGTGRTAGAEEEAEVEHVLRVLVVDDNEDAADSLAEVLRMLGHDAEVSYSGMSALQMAGDLEADLVLLDIGLPDLEGYEVARRLRRMVPPDTRLVALTGYGSEEDKRLSRQAGFDEHVTKPLMVETLREVLARAAAQRASPAVGSG